MNLNNCTGPLRQFIGVFITLAISACAGVPGRAPTGFAPLDDSRPFRAVTPEGLMYRVRVSDNKPRADLHFWKKALKQRMLTAGYVFHREMMLSTTKVPLYVLELAAPFGSQDFLYLIGIAVDDDDLVIIEAAGSMAEMKKHHPSITRAIKSIFQGT